MMWVSRTITCVRPRSRRRGISCTEATTTFCLAHARQTSISLPCIPNRFISSGSGTYTWKTSTRSLRSRTPPLYKHASSTLPAMWQTSVLPWRHSCSVYTMPPCRVSPRTNVVPCLGHQENSFCEAINLHVSKPYLTATFYGPVTANA